MADLSPLLATIFQSDHLPPSFTRFDNTPVNYRLLLLALCLTAAAPVASVAVAEESLAAQIDRLVAAGTPDYAKLAAPIASDAEFLRRVTLDLNGTIPTAADTRTFLADTD